MTPVVIPRSAAMRKSAMKPALRASLTTYVAMIGADSSRPILTPAAFERLEEFRRCFHADAVPQRREEVTPVIRDDHASPGGARHLGNVRVVDPAAGGIVLGGRVQKMQTIGRRQIVHGHPPEDLVLEQPCGIRRRQPELGGKPGRDREKLEATVPGSRR